MKLNEIVEHSELEIEEMLAMKEPYSAFENYVDFSILLLRRIEFGRDQLNFKSEFFVLKETKVFYLNREDENFVQLKKGYADLVGQLDQ
jgi:hypothetical protein